MTPEDIQQIRQRLGRESVKILEHLDGRLVVDLFRQMSNEELCASIAAIGNALTFPDLAVVVASQAETMGSALLDCAVVLLSRAQAAEDNIETLAAEIARLNGVSE